MRVVIIGTGALASLFGARLSRVAEVVLLGSWKAQLAALAAGPLQVREADGTFSSFQVRGMRDPEAAGPADLVLILVKAAQNPRALELIRALVPGDKIPKLAISLQNGAGNLPFFRSELPLEHFVQGITYQAARMEGPGKVADTGAGKVLLENPGEENHVQIAGDLLAAAGFEVEYPDDIDRLVWEKLAVNAAINPLTAMLGVPNGYLAEHEGTISAMVALAEEVKQVAAATGVPFRQTDFRNFLVKVAQNTAQNHSSMLQDIERGARTEIEAICGFVVREAAGLGLEVPFNKDALRQVQLLESGGAISSDSMILEHLRSAGISLQL